MPLYEYRCADCEHQYELREGFDAPVEHGCLRCGGRARRRYLPPVVVFKGSGFYSTDHRKSGLSGDSSTSQSQDHGHGHSDQGPATAQDEPLGAAEK